MHHEYKDSPGCVKCRNYDVWMKWQSARTAEREYLEVTCRECGYSWTMDTADTLTGEMENSATAERKRCMQICRDRARTALRLYHETGNVDFRVRKSEAICCEQAIGEVGNADKKGE